MGRNTNYQTLIIMKLKIMYLTAVATIFMLNAAFTQSGKVLFVMSEADTLLLNNEKKKRQTGVFLNEFYLAYNAISDNGYIVEFATPTGKKATIDQESLEDKYWEEKPALKQEAIEFWENNQTFSIPNPLKNVLEKQNEYIGLVIPGGQGLMVDLMYDENIPILLQAFAENKKAIGLICHAPSLITTISQSQNPFVGYRINSVNSFEEFYIEKFIMKGKPKNRKIARQLKKLGLEYDKGGPGKNYAVRGRNLVTSQNPFSGSRFNELFLELLTEIK
jgi:putative intracellular protease/amidase